CNFKFVQSVEDWEDGTCFVLKTNIYEALCTILEGLIRNNPENYLYFIIVDSMDGLMLREDSQKSFNDSGKVAGVPLLTSNFMKRMSLPIHEFGHTVVLLSQVRSTIKIDQYSKAEYKQTNGTGGHAIQHFA